MTPREYAMPMHDWTRVDAGIYHDLHGVWLYHIRRTLNGGVLPPAYHALVEQVVRPFEPDVLALEIRPPAPLPPTGGPTTTPRATRPPDVRTVATARRVRRRRAHRRLSVRHVSTHRLVAVVELVSPGNKSNRRDFAQLVNKAVTLLEAGVHVLLIDPFPPTARDPAGLHAAVWRAATRGVYMSPPDRLLTAASYVGGDEVTAYVEPFAVGLPVPPMPLFLDPDEYVTVPLEDTYQAAWADMTPPVRAVIEAP